MAEIVDAATLQAALRGLGAHRRPVVAHSSLSAFGRVVGGAATVVGALVAVCDTVLAPTFTYSPAAAVPPGQRIARNGADYDREPCGSPTPTPFTCDLPAERDMGVVAEALRCQPRARRSDHPLSSFAAVGPGAQRYVGAHALDEPLAPLARLLGDDGLVLMLGTRLTSCTAIHLGELHAGRRPFVRWAAVAGRPGVVPVRVGGCSRGFEALRPWLGGVRHAQVGAARVEAFPIRAVVAATCRALREDPQVLVCSVDCRRCRDAAAGGPA